MFPSKHSRAEVHLFGKGFLAIGIVQAPSLVVGTREGDPHGRQAASLEEGQLIPMVPQKTKVDAKVSSSAATEA